MPPKPRNRDRLSVYLLSVTLFVAGALLALLVTRGYAIDLDSLTLQKRGVVVLRSSPDSATIRLDDEPAGKRTDARLSLAPGTYRFTVEAPGRIPWKKEVDLRSGEAVIQEIILFPETPERTALTDAQVRRFAVSPGGDRIAAVVGDEALRLQLFDSRNGSRFSIRVPENPERIVVNDEGFVLTERAGRITVYGPTGRRTASIAGGNGSLIGNKIVFEQGRRVVETDRTGKSGRTMASSPASWIAAVDRVYVLDRAGRVVVVEPGRDGEPVDDAGTVSAIAQVGNGVIQATKPDGSFGVIQGSAFKSIGQGPAQSTLSPDGAFVTYRTNREIRLFELGTGKDRLVTSLTKPPEGVTALPGGYYLLYRQGTDLHAMARDGSNDRIVAKEIGSPPVVLSLDRVLTKDSRTGRLVRINLQD